MTHKHPPWPRHNTQHPTPHHNHEARPARRNRPQTPSTRHGPRHEQPTKHTGAANLSRQRARWRKRPSSPPRTRSASGQTADESPRMRNPWPTSIATSTARTTMNILGPEPQKKRPVPGKPAGGVVVPATTDQMASCHVPLADQYPRRAAGRNGAYRRRRAMASAPPLPPSPRRAQRPGQGNGAGTGSGLDIFRSLNTSRQHNTTKDSQRLHPRKLQVITAIH
jgi:hypothetical protein